ncbi:WXG100 family type VII secretion target [Blastococcus atacamensis]|uniref:WXG100 family type VII secretion target n=1 Tax=Blastococcus atacamensis TaxID=2070508 RepID=UPI000CEC745C|nr:WXG100 family type VII secretion target [Blastococcus atacamensis]
MTVTPVAPASFEPLDDRNGVPGDPEELATLARRYADTAAEIEAQAANLTALTSRSQKAWKGEAGDNFVEVAGDLAERIGRARGRYEAAARALDFFATALEVVQTEAYDAVRRAQAAEDSQRALRNGAPVAPPSGATPEQLLAAEDEQQTHQLAVFAADDALAAARRDYFFAVESYERAARTAAHMLSAGRIGDELVDDWWDLNAGWIDALLDAVSVVALTLVIVAVVVAVVLGPGVALVGTLMVTSSALSFVSATVRLDMWASGNGSFEDVLWDLAGAATLGFGKGVAVGAQGMLRVTERVGGRVGAARGGRQAFADAGRSPLLFDLGRLLGVRSLLELSPGLRVTFQAADDAGKAAREGVTAAAGSSGTGLTRAVSFAEDGIADALTAIHRIRQAAGGGAQLTALTALADSMVVGAVTVPNAVINGRTAWGLQDSVSVDPSAALDQAAADKANREAIVDRWSMPLGRVS